MNPIIRILLPGVLAALLLAGCSGPQKQEQKEAGDTLKVSVMKEKFGTADGREVSLYTLRNRSGIEVSITNYGAIITSIRIPDRDGNPADIVLGYDDLDSYVRNNPYFGCIAGRYANRIAKGEFTLDGKKYSLARNNGGNHLHGGVKGFDKVVWDAREFSETGEAGVELTYLSKDGEEGYPGNLRVTVRYALNDSDMLVTRISAQTDKPTPVNLCNHTYFNLTGGSAAIPDHMLQIRADEYVEVNSELIPTGKLLPVSGTPMDFIAPHYISQRIGQVPGGYDHTFVLKKRDGIRSWAAVLTEPVSGRQVTIRTTQPGIQFYSGNFLDGTITGKNGTVYKKHWGLCLETQHFPDSPNQPSFPNTILRPGETFNEVTAYQFSVIKL